MTYLNLYSLCSRSITASDLDSLKNSRAFITRLPDIIILCQFNIRFVKTALPHLISDIHVSVRALALGHVLFKFADFDFIYIDIKIFCIIFNSLY